jgi:uncharacterized protein involved in exopolysaccharide biosynthesis
MTREGNKMSSLYEALRRAEFERSKGTAVDSVPSAANINQAVLINNSAGWRNQEPLGAPPQLPLRPPSKKISLLLRLTRSLRFHWFVSALVFGSLILLFAVYLLRHKPTYTATSLIYVSPTFPKTLHDDSETNYPYDTYMQQQIHSITRREVLADAIHKLPTGAWRLPNEPEANAVTRLEHALTVNRVETTYQLSIMMQSSNPDHLADIVNAVTQTYLAKAKEEEFYGRDDRLTNLRANREELQQQLDSALQEQADITQKLGVAVIGGGDGTDPFDDQLARIRADLSAAHEQRVEAEAKLSSLKSTDPSSSDLQMDSEAGTTVANDPQLAAVKTELGQKRSTLMEQAAGLTEGNPVRKLTEAYIGQIDSGINEIESSLRHRAATQLEDRLHANLLRAGMVESALRSQLQKDSAAANSAAPKFQRATQLKADIDRLEARYTQVDDRISNLELESSSPGTAHLFSPAITPLAPEPDKLKKIVPFVVGFLFLLAIAAAVLADYLDPHVYTSEDVDAVLGFSPIGSLFADNEVIQLVYDEYVLRLAAAVDHSTRVANVRTFVLTATDKNGQTAPIVENVAHALAALGRRVITIDASGNLDPVAYANADLSEGNFAALQVSEPASQPAFLRGQPPAQQYCPPIASLSSFANEALQRLTNDYEIVLINAAPVLCSAETEYLARSADITILVATAGKTTKATLARAAHLLEGIDVAGVATIINEVSINRVSPSTRMDVKEFEERVDSLTPRWKLHVTPFAVGAARTPQSAEQQKPAAAKEPAVGIG